MLIKYRVCFDCDNVLNDLTAKMLTVYNARNGTDYTPDVFQHYDMARCVPPDVAKDMTLLFTDDEVLGGLEPPPDAYDVLFFLHKEGHEVFIASNTDYRAAERKAVYLLRCFPFLTPERIIFIANKPLLGVDFLIDDDPANFKNGLFTRILRTQPWNAASEVGFDHRIDRLNEVIPIIMERQKAESARANSLF